MFLLQKVLTYSTFIDLYQFTLLHTYLFATNIWIVLTFCHTFASESLQCGTKGRAFIYFKVLSYEED